MSLFLSAVMLIPAPSSHLAPDSLPRTPDPRPAPIAEPEPEPVVAPAGGVWAALRECESGGDYTTNTGNGFFGAYQFLPSTWSGLGYPGMPHEASPAMQDAAAQDLQARSGWGQWPHCAAELGLL